MNSGQANMYLRSVNSYKSLGYPDLFFLFVAPDKKGYPIDIFLISP